MPLAVFETAVFETIAELRKATVDARMAGKRVALVPTMGALHAGHLALVARARAECRTVAVSIFVNPLQFGPGEDFERYPRAFDGDVAALRAAGAAIVLPPVEPTPPFLRAESATLAAAP